mmetsp:Transcript_28746/g.68366  ORF Transcript_28746/g.68366 Transcript_28746/m.68366 type:complete len:169 (+) Transcript_28746:173-679(+)
MVTMDIVTKLMDIVTKLLVGKLVMNSMSAAAEWTTEKARVRMNAAASAVAMVMATGTGMASEAPNTDTATATAMAVMVRMVNMAGIPTVGTPRTFMAQRTARMASAVKKPAMASTDMASATVIATRTIAAAVTVRRRIRLRPKLWATNLLCQPRNSLEAAPHFYPSSP